MDATRLGDVSKQLFSKESAFFKQLEVVSKLNDELNPASMFLCGEIMSCIVDAKPAVLLSNFDIEMATKYIRAVLQEPLALKRTGECSWESELVPKIRVDMFDVVRTPTSDLTGNFVLYNEEDPIAARSIQRFLDGVPDATIPESDIAELLGYPVALDSAKQGLFEVGYVDKGTKCLMTSYGGYPDQMAAIKAHFFKSATALNGLFDLQLVICPLG